MIDRYRYWIPTRGKHQSLHIYVHTDGHLWNPGFASRPVLYVLHEGTDFRWLIDLERTVDHSKQNFHHAPPQNSFASFFLCGNKPPSIIVLDTTSSFSTFVSIRFGKNKTKQQQKMWLTTATTMSRRLLVSSRANTAAGTATGMSRHFASVGDMLPSVELHQGWPPKKYNLADFAKNKSVLLVGLPGAFTPTWSTKQIPNYLEHQDALREAGIHTIIVYCVNDASVMQAWGKDQKVGLVSFLFKWGGIPFDFPVSRTCSAFSHKLVLVLSFRNI